MIELLEHHTHYDKPHTSMLSNCGHEACLNIPQTISKIDFIINWRSEL